MASGDDPLADYQNMLGLQGLTGPNPYLEYTGQIPMAGFMGAPTNASGQPIQSFTDTQNASNAWNAANPPPALGTTLNSSPSSSPSSAQQQALRQAAANGQWGITSQMAEAGINSIPQANALRQQMAAGPTQQQAAAPAAPINPYNMRQAYLDALSNPGHVTTPGAVMQPGATPTGGQQPSVLAAFLAAHPGGGTQIPGGYSNQGFFSTLNNLQAQKQSNAS
jgi:hypothetical protein